VVIENPPGLLKSNDGRDFAAVAMGLEDLGYGWAYRVVDAGGVGSAQRRQRVLVVGHLGGDPRSAWGVLGDGPAGGEAPRARAKRGEAGRLTVASSADGHDEPLIWRKSARARKSLAAGGYETWVESEFSNVLTGFDGGGPMRQTHLVMQGGRLRTLTLREWERLQGFPDDWTAGIPESHRYQVIGDAMNVHQAAWLGRRIVSADRLLSERTVTPSST
jgi:DNA (cytosine-5)-methyltransferase 1